VNRFHRHYCASRGWADLVRTTLVPAALQGTELGRRVLELGPGPGLTTEVLAGAAPRLTAIEIRTVVDPATLGDRLRGAGFEQARVRTGSRIVFRAHRPR